MLSRDQAAVAVSLLREALDWVGLVDLTTEQEGQAEALQLRIERLLMDCGAMPGRRDLTEGDRYCLVVEARERMLAAERERLTARAQLEQAIRAGRSEAAVTAVRRYNRAYAEHEAAQRELVECERAYHRALARHEGTHRCSA